MNILHVSTDPDSKYEGYDVEIREDELSSITDAELKELQALAQDRTAENVQTLIQAARSLKFGVPENRAFIRKNKRSPWQRLP